MIRVELPHGLGPLTVSPAELLGQVTTCDNGVLGIPMPKVILDQPQVVAAVGQREAAGMSKHVRMHGRQPGTSGRLGQQIVHRLTRERLPPFGDEQPGQRIGAAGQVALDRLAALLHADEGMYRIRPRLLESGLDPSAG
jgi:hypothetical protein